MKEKKSKVSFGPLGGVRSAKARREELVEKQYQWGPVCLSAIRRGGAKLSSILTSRGKVYIILPVSRV